MSWPDMIPLFILISLFLAAIIVIIYHGYMHIKYKDKYVVEKEIREDGTIYYNVIYWTNQGYYWAVLDRFDNIEDAIRLVRLKLKQQTALNILKKEQVGIYEHSDVDTEKEQMRQIIKKLEAELEEHRV